MATSIESNYVGDGNTKLYTITFPFITQDDVTVALNGVLTSQYTFANNYTISFNTAPLTGVAIQIKRDTQTVAIENVFYPGSAIRAKDLNDNFTQSLYVIQEADLNVTESLDISKEALAAAEQAAKDAQQAADDAAQSAADAAQAAQDSASAQQDAAEALVAANAAQASADQAALDAAEAKTDAATAVTSAANAQAAANSAQEAASQANESATAALKAAQDAQASAEAALILVTDFVGQGQSYQNLYTGSAGSPGSKTIDLGDLSSISTCSNAHFPGEDVAGTETYNMGLGCSSIDYGSVA
jgi:hypothetical protein